MANNTKTTQPKNADQYESVNVQVTPQQLWGSLLNPFAAAPQPTKTVQKPIPPKQGTQASKPKPTSSKPTPSKPEAVKPKQPVSAKPKPKTPLTRKQQEYLISCVESGKTDVLKNYLKTHKNINLDFKDDEKGETLLHKAARKGNAQAIDALIEAGANVELTNKLGCMPIHVAAENNHFNAIQSLLKSNNDINIKDPRDGNSPLYWAARSGHAELVDELIKAGADVNITNKKGTTALHVAAAKDHPAVIQKLLEAKADINAQDNEKRTPLDKAASFLNLESSRVLIEAGADVTIKNKLGQTPLDAMRVVHDDKPRAELEALLETTLKEATSKKNEEATPSSSQPTQNEAVVEDNVPAPKPPKMAETDTTAQEQSAKPSVVEKEPVQPTTERPVAETDTTAQEQSVAKQQEQESLDAEFSRTIDAEMNKIVPDSEIALPESEKFVISNDQTQVPVPTSAESDLSTRLKAAALDKSPETDHASTDEANIKTADSSVVAPAIELVETPVTTTDTTAQEQSAKPSVVEKEPVQPTVETPAASVEETNKEAEQQSDDDQSRLTLSDYEAIRKKNKTIRLISSDGAKKAPKRKSSVRDKRFNKLDKETQEFVKKANQSGYNVYANGFIYMSQNPKDQNKVAKDVEEVEKIQNAGPKVTPRLAEKAEPKGTKRDTSKAGKIFATLSEERQSAIRALNASGESVKVKYKKENGKMGSFIFVAGQRTEKGELLTVKENPNGETTPTINPTQDKWSTFDDM